MVLLMGCQGNSSEPVALKANVDSVQPMTGLVLWADNPRLLTDMDTISTIEFSYLTYSDITTSNGEFDWQLVDDILSTAASRGHHVILRFRYTYPGVTTPSVPETILLDKGYRYIEASVEGLPTFIPDWSSSSLQAFTLSFLRAFAERYNNDKRLLLLQLGFGSYGEYHLYDGSLKLGETFPTKAFQETFVSTANRLFTTLQWAMSIDAANPSYSPLSTMPAIDNLHFGLFDDSLMHKTHSDNNHEYNRKSWLAFGRNRYEDSMMGGEINYYSGWDQEAALALPNGAWGKPFEWFAKEYHLTYVIANDQPAYQSVSRLKEASMALGYRFRMTAFDCNASICEITATNEGNAPLYYDAFICVNNECASPSLKGLQPGAALSVKVEGLSAPYNLTIDSPHLLEGQIIQFNADLP